MTFKLEYNEKWIAGYEDMYSVDTEGNVWSFKTGKRKALNPRVTGRTYKSGVGYLNVSLYKDNKERQFRVHRLVAAAFLPQVSGKDQVNHIDGNKMNNNVRNLEWCDGSENLRHAYSTGIFDGNGARKVVRQYKDGVFIQEYRSIRAASEATGATEYCIRSCCTGKRKTAAKFEWRFADVS